MHITIIGSGYVGLVSGTCLAQVGHDVVCVDTDSAKISGLLQGHLPIYEDGLQEMVIENMKAGRLRFTTDLGPAVEKSDAVFIAVGTPSRKSDGHADLTYVDTAALEIGRHLTGFTVIINKSTVPVGTGDRVERLVRSVANDADFAVVSNPEFLREGAAIDDFMHPDRVVIGSTNSRAAEIMRDIYRPICREGVPFLVLRRRSAELAKYAANAFLATKITFINEVANLCEQIEGDIGEVAQAIGLDRRIGPDFLKVGPGYGGSCFPKDTLAYMRTSQDYGAPQRIVEAVIAVNGERKRAMGRRVIRALDGNLHDRTVAMLGLTFKANTDDMRDSPAIDIVQAIQDAGGHVRAYDPQGMTHATYLMAGVTFCQSAEEALRGSDAAVVATDWDEFRSLDPALMRERLTTGVVVDLRNIYDPETMKAAGLNYTSVGR